MKKISIFLIIGVSVVGIFLMKRNSPTSSTLNTKYVENTNNNVNEVATSLPFRITVPQRWTSERFSFDMNTIPGGGPMQELFLSSPYADVDWEERKDPVVIIDWFHFNPSAPLSDIVPLIAHEQQYQASTTSMKGTDAVKIIMLGSEQISRDSEPPPFRTEYLLLRLPDARLVSMKSMYSTQESYSDHHEEVSTVLDSLILL